MNIALILSGGTGSRISSDRPKQYISVNGKMIITRCLEAVLSCKEIDAIQIVANERWRESIRLEGEKQIGQAFVKRFRGLSEPGENRQLSIYNGLRDIVGYEDTTETDIVIVHDAARPLVSVDVLERCIDACAERDGAMPALPMKDTVYLSEDGKRISSLLDRKQVVAGQAPEAFVLGKYLAANEALLPKKILSINGASEPAIKAGLDIAVIPGDERNFKITTDPDLERYKKLIEQG